MLNGADVLIDGAEVVYLYDGTIEGFLTVVFRAFVEKTSPADIQFDGNYQETMRYEYRRVETLPEQADRVLAGLDARCGEGVKGAVINAYMCGYPDKELKIYNYIVLALKERDKIYSMFDHPTVIELNRLAKQVGTETHKYNGFLRFSSMEGGIMFAEFSPNSFCLPYMMPHFSSRFNSMPFLIFDRTHNQVGIYDTKQWYLRSSEGLDPPPIGDDELQYRKLWRTFWNNAANDGRVNYKLFKQFLPSRYRAHMTELADYDGGEVLEHVTAGQRIGDSYLMPQYKANQDKIEDKLRRLLDEKTNDGSPPQIP